MTDMQLQCSCGAVQGVASDVNAKNGNRVVCCCSDCQAFIRYLEREDDVLDQFGGTDIYQTTQSQVTISNGQDQLRCLRLSPKGLIRWYTACCKTPIGNTMGASMPFVGIVHKFMPDSENRDRNLGPVLAYVQTQHARGTPDYPHSARKFPLGISSRIIAKMLVWKVRGLNKPSVFFKANGRPIVEPVVLDDDFSKKT